MIYQNIINKQTKENIREYQKKNTNIFLYNYTSLNKLPFTLNITKRNKYCYILININSQKFVTNQVSNYKIITINNIFNFYNDIFLYNKKNLQKHFSKAFKMLI